MSRKANLGNAVTEILIKEKRGERKDKMEVRKKRI